MNQIYLENDPAAVFNTPLLFTTPGAITGAEFGLLSEVTAVAACS